MQWTQRLKTAVCILTLGFSLSAQAEGNRYGVERLYAGEISAGHAFLVTVEHQGQEADGRFQDAIIVDVRDVREYSAGHPEDAYSVPYPHIYSRPGRDDYLAQDPTTFVNAVAAIAPALDTPILTLCRTGMRSVLAANLLADAGYTNVHNIWQGFIGRTFVDVQGDTVDANNDGQITDADKDGWANFQGLPVDTKLDPDLLFTPYQDLYY